jgi:DnaK suppressor protein
MSQELSTTQMNELRSLLLARRTELLEQMEQNRENLTPPTQDEGAVLQRNVAREIDQTLTDIDATDLVRIDHALKRMDDDSYGMCDECGCSIPFERLQIEPQTQHCVACKSRWENKQAGR